jgi:putative ABC transport system permease protein
MSQWFLNLFSIDHAVFQLSRSALLLQVVAALLAPLLAGLWPVLKGASITVREAIATYCLGADFGSRQFDGLVERLGMASSQLPMPLRSVIASAAKAGF